ncbi:MAG: DUF1638 domain-containing protein, partial [Inquilinus sp.]|nr:DUF1638 domain-containing protein [Inquilinus sp.]
MSAEAPPVVTARSSAIRKATPDKTLIVACGALAREITALITTQGWSRIAVTCLPASLHNQPRQIAGRLRTVILAAEGRYRRVMVAYGDCGSGGAINAVLAET